MKVKPKAKTQILAISDRMVEVDRVSGNTITFKAYIDMEPAAAIEYGLVTCEFKVFNSTEKKAEKPKLSSIDSSEVFQSSTIRKVSAIRRYTNTIARGNIDVTKQIPNDRISAITRGAASRLKKVINLSADDDDASSQIKSTDSASDQSLKGSGDFIASRCHDLINRKGIDPASIFNEAPFHASIPKVSRGFRSSGIMSKIEPKDLKLRNSFVEDGKKKLNVRFETAEESKVEVPFTFRISKSLLGTYYVEVDAFSRAVAWFDPKKLQTLKFSVDLRRAYENFIIPTRAPTLQVTNVGSSKFIRAKQVDRNSTSLKIFRRSYSEKNDSKLSHFAEVATITARFGEEIQFVDRPDTSGKCLYRVVPFNELLLSSGEFSSAIVPGIKSKEKKSQRDSTAMLAVEKDDHVTISAFNIPDDIVSARLIRRNLVLNETRFSSPSSVFGGPIKGLNRSDRNLTFDDFITRPESILEYKLVLIDSYGEERESVRSALVYFVGDSKIQEGRTIQVQAPKVVDDQEFKVTFQIEAPTEKSALDRIYSILIDQGLSDQYVDEIKQNRELFGKIVAFEMLRFDTVTGVNESFGVIKEGTFEDSRTTRHSRNVSKIVPGRKYIYNYRLLIRAPGTLFDSANVERLDLETGKYFKTGLKKFNAPRVLIRGTLASNVSQQRTFSKTGLKSDPARGSVEELIAGRSSLTGMFEITAPEISTSIEKVSVEETSRGNVVRWYVNEGIQEIDHLIIYADYNGRLAPLRSLQYTKSGNMVYLDDRLSASLNEVSYYLRPVFLNFEQGQLVGPAKVDEDAN